MQSSAQRVGPISTLGSTYPDVHGTFVRHRGRWTIVGLVTLFLPLVWPLGVFIAWKLWTTRKVRAEAAAIDLAAGIQFGPHSQAGTGMICGRCRRPLSPAWRSECYHCGTSFEDATPISGT